MRPAISVRRVTLGPKSKSGTSLPAGGPLQTRYGVTATKKMTLDSISFIADHCLISMPEITNEQGVGIDSRSISSSFESLDQNDVTLRCCCMADAETWN